MYNKKIDFLISFTLKTVAVFLFLFIPFTAVQALTITAPSGGDCGDIGSWNEATNTCTLSQDTRSNIALGSDVVLDGNNYRVGKEDGDPTSTSSGINIGGSNVTVKNVVVSRFNYGISVSNGAENVELSKMTIESNRYGVKLSSAINSAISDCQITDNLSYGLIIENSSNNTFSNNTIGPNNQTGVYQRYGSASNIYENNDISGNLDTGLTILDDGSDSSVIRNNAIADNSRIGAIIRGDFNTLSGNTFSNNATNLTIEGNNLLSNEIDTSNTIEEKPVYYLKNISDQTFDGALTEIGAFYCIECDNISLQNAELADNGAQIFFYKTVNSKVEKVTATDKSIRVELHYSTDNSIKNSDLDDFKFYHASNGNLIVNNNIWNVDRPLLLSLSYGNDFEQDLPVGGNYWQAHNSACQNSDGDDFCDNAFYYKENIRIDDYPKVDPFEIESVTGNANVLFLPGIKASRLYRENAIGIEDKLWPPNYFGDDLEELMLDDEGNSIKNVYTRDVIEKAGGTSNIYKSFIGELDDLKNTQAINDYSLFAYDWRQSVTDIAQNGTPYPDWTTKSAIAELENLAATAQNKKVTIVAHSNGGLLAKAMMLELEKLGKADQVDKIIMVSTPQMGTPKAILSLLYGYDEGSPLGLLISRDKARKLSENMPGAYGLIPSKTYFNRTEEPLISFSSEHTRYKEFEESYGEKIGDVEEFYNFLLAEKDKRNKPATDEVELENILNEDLLAATAVMHEQLDSWSPPENVQLIEIGGWGLDTVSGVEYTEREKAKCISYYGYLVPSCHGDGKYEPIYEPRFTVDGDEVVTTPSSLMLPEGDNVERYWVDLYRYNKENKNSKKHKNILEIGNLIEFFSDIIKDENDDSLFSYIQQSRPEDYEDAPPRIRMSLYSPLDIHLYDNQGRHTGPMVVTDEAGNEAVTFEEAIPNSYYRQIGERKYVGFPGGEDIEVRLEGYAEGAFSLEMEEVEPTESGEEITGQTAFVNLPTSADTVVSLNIPVEGLSEVSPLQSDYDGDGTADYTIEAVPDGEATMPDLIAPETTISLEGTLGNNNWYRSGTTVTLTAEDNFGGSGVKSILYSLDSGDTWNNYAEPFALSEEKIHQLQYYAIDNEDNQEEPKEKEIKIDRTAPETIVTFDEVNQELKIEGIDNLSEKTTVSVTEEVSSQSRIKRPFFGWLYGIINKEKPKTYLIAILTDEAGNRTELKLEQKTNDNNLLIISPETITYNEQDPVQLPGSTLRYLWKFNEKKDRYNLFSARLMTDNKVLQSYYLPRADVTWIRERDKSRRRFTWESFPGMTILHLQTENGKLKIIKN
jgi:parallel beta-helix repeat protein